MRVAKLDEKAIIPTRKNKTDAGLDLYPLENVTVINPGDVKIIGTGITVEIPQGYFGWITNKSKSNFLIGGGIVDEGYQGELLVKVINPTTETYILYHEYAFAQLLVLPVIYPTMDEVTIEEIHKVVSDRGSDGGIVKQVEEKPGWYAWQEKLSYD